MRHPQHAKFLDTLRQLSVVRASFAELAKAGLILGNDNHIGDIGEYWARRYYEQRGEFLRYGAVKNAPSDIELKNGTHVSVKTLSAWSDSGYGTQVKPLDGKKWQTLFTVFLSEDLYPQKIAIVPLTELIQKPVFAKNRKRRTSSANPTKSFPRFEWWDWLEDYEITFSVEDGDLVVGTDA